MQARLFSQKNLPKNLVFSGGGVNIIGHAGAVVACMEAGVFKEVKRVAGASAGALIGLLIMLKMSPQEIRDFVMELDFKKFLADNLFTEVLRGGYNFFTSWGFFRNVYLRALIDKLIASKLGFENATLADLQKYHPEMEYSAVTYNNSHKCTQVFSTVNSKEMAADVVAASMSVPFVFSPSVLNKNPVTGQGDLCVDGATINNYFLHIFDKKGPDGRRIANKETLGFLLAEPAEVDWMEHNILPAKEEYSGIFGLAKYSLEIVRAILFRQKHEIMRSSEDVARTVFIPICADPLNPILNQATRKQAFQLGQDAALRKFKKPVLQEFKYEKPMQLRSAL